jgi:hypothetical protein
VADLRDVRRGAEAAPSGPASDADDEPFAFAGGQIANRPVPTVHFRDVRGEVTSFQYLHLASPGLFSRSDGRRGRFVVWFTDDRCWRVTVEGRNLWKLYAYLGKHRAEVVQESSPERDAGGPDDTVVYRVQIEDDTESCVRPRREEVLRRR